MQKFGWESPRVDKLKAVELEVIKEKACTLGRTDRKLKAAIIGFESLEPDSAESDKTSLLNDIADAVWALILEREFCGFHFQNMEWIHQNYDIPKEALCLLGTRKQS